MEILLNRTSNGQKVFILFNINSTMKSIHLFFIISLVGFNLARSAPMEEKPDFFGNIDYNQVVSHMKELMMYLPVLMTTVKETMTGFPKINEGINSLGSRRLFLGSGRQNDGKCRCKQLSKHQNDASIEDMGY
ncbi:uncharacterized protein LOC129919969 [Episyrphus balteatus]|uniref:uncharacterized protein LOC129919969 n=1 Tax=Episyrphus balteatus TaxID=286459 RepID=UPI0024859F2B|nr:uncharacterized protein LOC129919969 [Episyrphus balteatus]